MSTADDEPILFLVSTAFPHPLEPEKKAWVRRFFHASRQAEAQRDYDEGTAAAVEKTLQPILKRQVTSIPVKLRVQAFDEIRRFEPDCDLLDPEG